jgi:hypothetical protein
VFVRIVARGDHTPDVVATVHGSWTAGRRRRLFEIQAI